jgi:capsular polysaccharide biosynthesis protein
MLQHDVIARLRADGDRFSGNGALETARRRLRAALILRPEDQTSWFHAGLIESEWARYTEAAEFYLRGAIIDGFARSGRALFNQIKRGRLDFARFRQYFRAAKPLSLDHRAVHLSVEKQLLNRAAPALDTDTALAKAAGTVAPVAEARILAARPITDFLCGDLARLPKAVVFNDMIEAGITCGDHLIKEPFASPSEDRHHRFVRFQRETGARFDTAFFAGFGAQYYHWSIETTHNLKLYIDNKLDMPLLVHGPHPHPFHREMLELLELDQVARPVLSNPGVIMTDTLIVTRHVGAAHCMEATHIRWLANTLRERVAESTTGTGPEKIYISRNDTRRKRVLGEDALIDLLTQNGFTTLELAKLSLREQITAFANARVVVGAKGAGLTNLIYSAEGTRVVELTPTVDPNFRHFERLAEIVGVQHSYVKSTRADEVKLWGGGHDAPARFDNREILRAIENA